MSFGWKLSQWKYVTTLNRIDILHSRSKEDLMDLKRIYNVKNNSYLYNIKNFYPYPTWDATNTTAAPPPLMHI